MAEVITLQGENLIAEKMGNQEIMDADTFILSYDPDLDPTAPIDRESGLPDSDLIVYQDEVTQAGYVNPNQVVYSLFMDNTVGPFQFNRMDLVSSTDDNTNIAIATFPAQNKIADDPENGIRGQSMTRNFMTVYDGAQTITGITVEAAVWQIDFMARLHASDQLEVSSNRDIYGRACFWQDGFKVVNEGGQFKTKAGTGYVEGIRLYKDQAIDLDPGTLPKDVWLDISLQGNLNGVSSVIEPVYSSSDQSDYIDSNGINHFMEKIAEVSSSGVVTDTRPVADIAEDLLDYIELRYAPSGYGLGQNSLNITDNVDELIQTETGWFRAVTDTPGNPTDGSGYAIQHMTYNRSSNHFIQLGFRQSSLSDLFIRTHNDSGWTDWFQFYTTRFKPTASDVGALGNTGNQELDGALYPKVSEGSADNEPSSWSAGYSLSAATGNSGYAAYGTLTTSRTGTGRISQIMAYPDSGIAKIRFRVADPDDGWLPWAEIYSNQNKPSADDVSAIPKTTNRLSSSVNIDDLYQENGIYECTQNNMDDPPLEGSWDATLLVLAAPNQVDQWLCPGDGNLFHRVDDGNPVTGNEWREWRRIFTSREPPTPPGIITGFAGTEAQIPSGWQLCNGSGETSNGIKIPDLLNRMIICAGDDYDVGDSGGSETATTNSKGTHSHNVTVNSGGSHSHTITVNSHTLTTSQIPSHNHKGENFSRGSDTNGNPGYIAAGRSIGDAVTTSAGGSGSHSHSAISSSTGSHSHSASNSDAGSHNHTVSTLSPYYALAFIIKL